MPRLRETPLPARLSRHASRTRVTPRRRLANLLDPGSLQLLTLEDESGMLAVTGAVDGSPVVAFCSDATLKGGAMGQAGCDVVVRAYEHALAEGTPVIGVWHPPAPSSPRACCPCTGWAGSSTP